MTPLTLNFHFGDNASVTTGEFAGTTFVGLSMRMPVRITNVTAPAPVLILRTSAIETLAPWQAHRVLLDGSLLGLLKDDEGQPAEVHQFETPTALTEARQFHELVIEVGAAFPGLLDDFVLKEIELTGAELVLGWV